MMSWSKFQIDPSKNVYPFNDFIQENQEMIESLLHEYLDHLPPC